LERRYYRQTLDGYGCIDPPTPVYESLSRVGRSSYA
jgi:hypothetical protein